MKNIIAKLKGELKDMRAILPKLREIATARAAELKEAEAQVKACQQEMVEIELAIAKLEKS